jgi:hypothetical protein
MLFKRDTLYGIRDGGITLAFRCWRQPRVKPGTVLHTGIGLVRIDAVDRVAAEAISSREAKLAGFVSPEAVRASLRDIGDGSIYRVKLHLAGPDPRIALRETKPATEDISAVIDKLKRLDRASPRGPWTADVLALVRDRPETRAADLAARLGRPTLAFKTDVRKLKALGLTESLEIGYRLSPRGKAVLRALSGNAPRR